MLEDRDYMRQPAYHESRVSFTVALLILCAIVFVIECIACGYPPNFSEGNYFALSVDGLKHGYVWQLLTYQFMHAGLMHILLNGWAIYIFGRAIEETLGSKNFLILFLTSGVIGGLVQMIGALVWPSHIGAAAVGASAAALGLVAAFAMLYPERELTLLLFFVLPLNLRAKYLLLGTALLSILCILFPNSWLTILLGGNIAYAAHLGGMLTGIIFIRQFIQGHWHWPQWKFSGHRNAPREFVAAGSGKNKSGFWRSAAGKYDEDFSTDEFLQKEVDPILEKISAHGIQSLTAHEREILEKARAKMAKR
jgi:membrane associated rhomboid family serine protease